MRTEFLVGKPGGKRALGRSRRVWRDNIKMDRSKVECGMVSCVSGQEPVAVSRDQRGFIKD